jgi:hemerythrin
LGTTLNFSEGIPTGVCMLLTWSDEFSVKIKELDEHHRKIFSILNKLFDEINKGSHSRVVLEVLTDLDEYASYHFQAEEELFRKKNYPDAQEHMREHEVFRSHQRKLDELVRMNDNLAGLELSEFLSSWLISHVLTTDKKYIPYLT